MPTTFTVSFPMLFIKESVYKWIEKDDMLINVMSEIFSSIA